jgi:hypothetical protein
MHTKPGAVYSSRMLRIARRLYEGHVVTAKWIMTECGVSWSCAKKDMQLVAMYLPVEIDKPQRWPGTDPREKRLRLMKHTDTTTRAPAP